MKTDIDHERIGTEQEFLAAFMEAAARDELQGDIINALKHVDPANFTYPNKAVFQASGKVFLTQRPTSEAVSDYLARKGGKAEWVSDILDSVIPLASNLPTLTKKLQSSQQPIPPSSSQLEEDIKQIANLDPVAREQKRKELAKKYKVRACVIDECLDKIFPPSQAKEQGCIVREEDPAEDEVNGAELLDRMEQTIGQHVVMQKHYATAAALWTALTYCYDLFRILPQLSISSPDKRCGKTTFLEVLHGLVNRPIIASNISPAAVYRVIEKYNPTLIVDEADTFLKDNIELRGILNSGHSRSTAFVIRVDPETLEPFKFNTFGPKIIAGIGQQSDTQRDRSIKIVMRRKLSNEKTKRLTVDFEDNCIDLRRGLMRWSEDNLDGIRAVAPIVPSVGNDRAEDNWYPLFAIAQIAGGSWPEKVDNAFRLIESVEADDSSIGPVLLQDIKAIFQERGIERIFSENLVDALIGRKESP
jgi:hypothetical protein